MSASKNGDGRLAFLEKVYIEDRKRWAALEALHQEDSERRHKNDERLEKESRENHERWARNDERLMTIVRRLQVQQEHLASQNRKTDEVLDIVRKQGDDLRRQGDELKRQGDRLESLQKDHYRRSEHGRG